MGKFKPHCPIGGGVVKYSCPGQKINGAIMDGFVKAVQQIKKIGFPIYAAGIAPLDSKVRGKVIEVDVSVERASVRACLGDVIFSAADGCVAIPKQTSLKSFLVVLKN